MNSGRTTITRVTLRNYKSIAACDVKLAPLAVLVGPNGSGKSNFLDALRFVAESLRLSLDHALRDRDGIQNVRRRSGGHPKDLQIRLDFRLPEVTGWFAFRIRALPDRGHVLKREKCHVFPVDNRLDRQHYRVEAGSVVESSLRHPPASSGDRLYLVAVSGMKGFRSVYDALEGMAFHNLNPDRMMEMQPPDPGGRLARDGGNLASVLARLNAVSPERTERLVRYLGRIVPGVIGVESRVFGDRLALEFRQRVRGAAHPRRFRGNDLSDGTLRALGVLVALFQTGATGFPGPRVVGVEKPESALHPGASGVLAGALRAACEWVQVLVTSHSTELLDEELPADSILAVNSEDNETRIGPVDEVGRSALHERLFSVGELLRLDQLRPAPETGTPGRLRDLFRPAPPDCSGAPRLATRSCLSGRALEDDVLPAVADLA